MPAGTLWAADHLYWLGSKDASGFSCQYIERRKESLAGAGSRDRQGAGLALAADCPQCFESALLHFIGLDFFMPARD